MRSPPTLPKHLHSFHHSERGMLIRDHLQLLLSRHRKTLHKEDKTKVFPVIAQHSHTRNVSHRTTSSIGHCKHLMSKGIIIKIKVVIRKEAHMIIQGTVTAATCVYRDIHQPHKMCMEDMNECKKDQSRLTHSNLTRKGFNGHFAQYPLIQLHWWTDEKHKIHVVFTHLPQVELQGLLSGFSLVQHWFAVQSFKAAG